ncbi:MAG: condensation domain-containing protein, partial [Clostridium sp.]
KKREEILDISADRLTHFINKEFYDKITSFCERHNFSIFNFLFANVVLVLSNYTNKNDVSLGTVILNRSNKVERNTLGMFISTLAVRLQFQKDISYIEFIGIVRSELMKGIRHQASKVSL